MYIFAKKRHWENEQSKEPTELKEVYVTGFFRPSGVFYKDMEFDSAELAAHRVHYLNGGCPDFKPPSYK